MRFAGLSSIVGILQTLKIKVKTTESFDPICHMISMKPKFADGLRRTVVHRRESANMNSQNDGNRKYWFTLVMSSTWNLNLPVDVLGLSSMAGHPLMINDEVGTWMGPWSALSRSRCVEHSGQKKFLGDQNRNLCWFSFKILNVTATGPMAIERILWNQKIFQKGNGKA